MTQTSRSPARICRLVLERALLWIGLALAAIYLSAGIYSAVSARLAMWAFSAAEESRNGQTPILTTTSGDGGVDLSLWSTKRIHAYTSSLALKLDRPLAVLSIPKLRLTAPVFEGTDSLTLNRGLGRIGGTAAPGEEGNIGIAGHRDGFFRPLKSIAPGDAIELATARGLDVYIVDRINITDPADVRVLESRSRAELTLVTCYPFNFIGSAPKRYIVQASLKQRSLHLPVPLVALAHLETPKEK
jgi:sortase A